jgi:hypothetical protein
VPIKQKDMEEKAIKFLVDNIDHFNVTTIARWCSIERSRMQRCITGASRFTEEEIKMIRLYFKSINDAVTQVCNEG